MTGRKGRKPVNTNSAEEDKNNLVECVKCNEWTPYEITGIKESFEEIEKNNIEYICRLCNLEAVTLSLRADKEVMSKKISDLESEVSRLKEQIGNAHLETGEDTDVSVLEDPPASSRPNTYADAIKAKPNALITAAKCIEIVNMEINDKEKRKCNLVMFNIPEAASSEPEIVTKNDSDHYNTLTTHIGLEDNAKPKQMRRLGKKKGDTSSPRPLLVSYRNDIDSQTVFRYAYRCKGLILEGQTRQVGIATDKSPSERLEIRNKFHKKKNQQQEAAENRPEGQEPI